LMAPVADGWPASRRSLTTPRRLRWRPGDGMRRLTLTGSLR
jgi:hypothetical protein